LIGLAWSLQQKGYWAYPGWAAIIWMVVVGLKRIWAWMQDLLRRRQQSLQASDAGYHMVDLGG